MYNITKIIQIKTQFKYYNIKCKNIRNLKAPAKHPAVSDICWFLWSGNPNVLLPDFYFMSYFSAPTLSRYVILDCNCCDWSEYGVHRNNVEAETIAP
jgi:hypothetical protein